MHVMSKEDSAQHPHPTDNLNQFASCPTKDAGQGEGVVTLRRSGNDSSRLALCSSRYRLGNARF